MMTHKQTHKTPAVEISPANFPALRSFLRGYFHEDMADEYGTLEEAVRQFEEDADPVEWKTTAGEWEKFVAATKGQSLAAINQALGKIGSASTMTDEDFDHISRAFQGLPPD
jgi:CdiI immunity protein